MRLGDLALRAHEGYTLTTKNSTAGMKKAAELAAFFVSVASN
jgi:hypothetical protein